METFWTFADEGAVAAGGAVVAAAGIGREGGHERVWACVKENEFSPKQTGNDAGVGYGGASDGVHTDRWRTS